MKKIMILGLVLAIITLPTIGASYTSQTQYTPVRNPITTSENFTHTVFNEYVTTTACPYCVTASAQLFSIYESGDYDQYYATLVVDQAKKVWPRVQELGTEGVPDVHIDGGFRNYVGEQNDEQVYRTAIESAGARDVPDMDIDVSFDFKSGGTLNIAIMITNNEDEAYNGHLRLYIVEPVSRWDDLEGTPYHYAALDIPIDRDVIVKEKSIQPLGDVTEITKTWIGALWGFSDITEDNIMVIASVFDPDTGYVIESAAATPTTSNTIVYRFPIIQEIIANLRARLLNI